jgi:hypothetical protein
MLLASGSPGSALAYHLGVIHSEAGMVRRNIATLDAPSAPAKSTEPEFGDLFFHPSRTLR